MKVLILTSSGGTAHDAAAYSIKNWLRYWDPTGSVLVEHLLEKSSFIMRSSVKFYNWIQKYWPWLHQIYWRLVEFEDFLKPGTVIFGRSYFIRLLRDFSPELIISTHPHINRGHFDLAKRVIGPSLRTITCCTEIYGGFGFSRNWLTRKADVFWALTPEVAEEVFKRGYKNMRLEILGPLFDPSFEDLLDFPLQELEGLQLPLLILGSGANGANNHLNLLNTLLPLSGQIRVVALCGKRESLKKDVHKWASLHPALEVEALGFQSPEEMAKLYLQAWALVARPGARTATEALATGCVLIFNGFSTTMPQELLARRYFSNYGIDVAINRPEKLLHILKGWLDHPQNYSRLKDLYRLNLLKGNREGIRQLIMESA
ncbi:MGDG synthase family glycosyltransferase [Prochlorococcus sp. MIT 1307]|uniref:MGDG synthase family glycosyltransferase n=1 Tax=Prochlorococcus sp. MIT 1307 TaxID=3096219 RepID=UPI002A75CAC9|nr:hypothetical protein [Prochlorococcus sp. MIT 1307]